MTAEAMRRASEPEWLQLVGLIHDLGKVLCVVSEEHSTRSEDGMSMVDSGMQWSVGGDTFIVGCAFPGSLVFPEFNCLNSDTRDKRYTSETGVYTQHGGLDQAMFSYGHDEYMYTVLASEFNPNSLPKCAKSIIRYHSAYTWHSGDGYRDLMSDSDAELLAQVRHFNKYDLYSKVDPLPVDMAPLWEYYEGLYAKFFENEKIQF